MSVSFVATDDLLTPSVYFSAAYGHALEVRDVSRIQQWVKVSSSNGEFQLPLMLTELGNGQFEAQSPYGYSGMYLGSGNSPEVHRDAWRSARELLLDFGVVSIFLRHAPFEPRSVEIARTFEGIEHTVVSSTIAIDTVKKDDVWNAMRGRARTAVRKALNAGMTAEVIPARREDLVAGSNFRRLYESTMQRLEADRQHYYSDAYYSMLLRGLGEGLQLATVYSSAGEAVAASLVMVDKSGVHYHLSGSNPVATRDGANNLLVWSILEWSANAGHSLVHLGGGTSRLDSLYKFKASFGGEDLPFTVGRVIVNSSAYSRLVQQRALELGVAATDLKTSRFFPEYRATVASNGH